MATLANTCSTLKLTQGHYPRPRQVFSQPQNVRRLVDVQCAFDSSQWVRCEHNCQNLRHVMELKVKRHLPLWNTPEVNTELTMQNRLLLLDTSVNTEIQIQFCPRVGNTVTSECEMATVLRKRANWLR